MLEDIINRYQNEYWDVFCEAEGKESEECGEFTLEQNEVHLEFRAECEHVLEGFRKFCFLKRFVSDFRLVEEQQVDMKVLYEECQECLDEKWCALFQEDANKWFVDLCINLNNFEWFKAVILQNEPTRTGK